MKLRLLLGLAALLIGGGAAMPATAQDGIARLPSPTVALEVGASPSERWLPNTVAPQSARLRAPSFGGPGPMQLRWGVDLRHGVTETVHPFVGLGVMTGRRTTLYVEQGVPENPAALPFQSAPVADTHLGLEFRTGSKHSALREFGTLRMQVGLNSRLSLKPRRGGATITWHSVF